MITQGDMTIEQAVQDGSAQLTGEMPLNNHPQGRGCWYMTYIDECVLCGRGETVRVRQWTSKPPKSCDRYNYVQTVCQSHFI